MTWTVWFAWRPVKTISGKWVFWQYVYRKIGNTYVDYDNWTWYYYGDDFDILRDLQYNYDKY